MELGFLFKNLIECTRTPNRARLIRTLKLLMLLLKKHRNASKYADEILRFLVLLLMKLPERQGLEMFYSLFVNTCGKPDGHIATDLQMEYLVNTEKKHIKHMSSNKTQQCIIKKSAALSGIGDICRHFDDICDVLVRQGKHSTRSAHEDELVMIADIHALQPFDLNIEHRPMGQWFKKMGRDSLLSDTDWTSVLAWIERRGLKHLNSKVD